MDQVSEVREKIDLVSLISEYITLKKAGRNFKALCPFHQEKTPSFIVSPERQIWHCFGCGRGGDCFTFLMEYENMEFPESLRTLAKKAGITLSSDTFKSQYSQKEKIYNINSISSKFYNYLLTKHQVGKKALDYLLKKRGLNLSLINNYSLGFSPSDNSLSSYLIKKKNFKERELIDAGISYIKDEKLVDFFKARIMFPLTDHRGNIVGFSGRSLDENPPGGSKYINTKDTVAYHKGDLFFGFDRARMEIKKKDDAILVEGEFDVLSLILQGIKNVIAIKGTALTENQAKLLSRFAKKVSLCLDQDIAGYEATKRSLLPLEKNGLSIDIVLLDEKDPDEAIKKSPASFKKALKDQSSVYDFLISKTISKNDKDTADGKRKITEELLPLLANISNEVVKEHFIKKLAKAIDTSQESLLKEIQKIKTEKAKEEIMFTPRDKRSRREILEAYLVSLIIQNENPLSLLEKEEKFLSSYKFENTVFAKILEYFKIYPTSSRFRGASKFNIEKFIKNLPKELLGAFDNCYLFPVPKFEHDEKLYKEIDKLKDELSLFHLKNQIIAKLS